jgi:hypothetical protein
MVRAACATREEALRTLKGLLAMQLVSPEEIREGAEARLAIILPVYEVCAEDSFDLVAEWIMQAFSAPKRIANSMLEQMAAAYLARHRILGVIAPADTNTNAPEGLAKQNLEQP